MVADTMSKVTNPFKIYLGNLHRKVQKQTLQQVFSQNNVPEPDIGIYFVLRVLYLHTYEIVLESVTWQFLGNVHELVSP